MQPWLPKAGHIQTLISVLDVDLKSGFAAVITEGGKLNFWVGTGESVEVITTDFSPDAKRWVEVKVVIDGSSFTAAVTPLSLFASGGAPPVAVEHQLQNTLKLSEATSLILGASYAESATASFSRPTNFFNGRLDSPSIKTTSKPSTT